MGTRIGIHVGKHFNALEVRGGVLVGIHESSIRVSQGGIKIPSDNPNYDRWEVTLLSDLTASAVIIEEGEREEKRVYLVAPDGPDAVGTISIEKFRVPRMGTYRKEVEGNILAHAREGVAREHLDNERMRFFVSAAWKEVWARDRSPSNEYICAAVLCIKSTL